MTDILVIAKDNAYGLSRHSAILREALEAAGHRVMTATPRSRGLIDRLLRRRHADIAVHMERVAGRWVSAADRNLLMPMQERFPRRLLPGLRRIDGVLANTHIAETIFSGLGINTFHLGYTSVDRLDADVEKDWNRFFHLAGGSTLKGTEDLVALWAKHPEWPELVLVQKAENAPRVTPANVRLISGYMDDSELRRLQNACGVHLCPSRSEGWGHYIVEGLSVGAVVVATDAPPMNEHIAGGAGIAVAWSRSEPRHLGINHYVDSAALESAVERIIALPDADKAAMGTRARQRFLDIDAAFRARISTLFQTDAMTGHDRRRRND